MNQAVRLCITRTETDTTNITTKENTLNIMNTNKIVQCVARPVTEYGRLRDCNRVARVIAIYTSGTKVAFCQEHALDPRWARYVLAADARCVTGTRFTLAEARAL